MTDTAQDDTTRVRIAYDPNNLKRIGSVVDLPKDQARQLIREGRAAEVDEGAELLDTTQPAEVEHAIAAGRTKADLIDLAAAHGLEVDSKATKTELVATLAAAGVDAS